MKKLIFTSILIVFLSSCTKNDTFFNEPKIPNKPTYNDSVSISQSDGNPHWYIIKNVDSTFAVDPNYPISMIPHTIVIIDTIFAIKKVERTWKYSFNSYNTKALRSVNVYYCIFWKL